MNMSTAEYVRSVRALNDQFRKTLKGGTLIFTSGVMALGTSLHEQVLQRLGAFGAFDTANDPHGEHDFGCRKSRASGCSGRSTTTISTWSGSQPIRLD